VYSISNHNNKVTGGTSLLPDSFAVNLLEFCCANIVVVRQAVAASNSNVAPAALKITTVLIFVIKTGLRKVRALVPFKFGAVLR
jgi:hypothetical protein